MPFDREVNWGSTRSPDELSQNWIWSCVFDSIATVFPSGLCSLFARHEPFVSWTTFLLRRIKARLPLTESLTPPGQVPANDRQSYSLHLQGAYDEQETGPRSQARKAETQDSSLSPAFVRCPSLPERHHRGHCSDPKLRFILSLMEVTKESFFYGIQLAPGKKSLSFCSRCQCLLWALVCLLLFCSLDGRTL